VKVWESHHILGLGAKAVLILVAACAAATAGGLLIDATGFLIALLASVPALILAGLAAVYLFDRVTEQRSEARQLNQWKSVRVATLAAIWEQTRRMTEPIRERSPHNTFAVDYEKVLELMDEVHAWIGTQAVRLADDDGTKYESTKADLRALHGDVFKEYCYLRDLLIPRVLEFAADSELLELLLSLEAAERQWSGCVYIAGPGETETSWASFPESAWEATAAFYKGAIDVVRYISAHEDRPDLVNGLRLVLVDVNGRTISRSWTLYEHDPAA
jgi:hypothetical protein